METGIIAWSIAATVVMGATIAYGFRLTGRRGPAEDYPRVRGRARLLQGLCGLMTLGMIGWAVAALLFPGQAGAEGAGEAAAGGLSVGDGIHKGLGYLGAGLATGCAAIGAGIGVGIAGAAGIGAISEKPEMLGKSLIYVGLAEGVAIYGLLISFMILNRV